jgi:hypothetical protein
MQNAIQSMIDHIPDATVNSVHLHPSQLTPGQRLRLRILYGINFVGAGVPGLVMISAPTWAANNMFPGEQDPAMFGVTGAIWAAIGLLSLAGLRYPRPLAAIFPLQVLYKSLWILTIALPMLMRGERAVLPMLIFFAIVVVVWLVTVPWTVLGFSAASFDNSHVTSK